MMPIRKKDLRSRLGIQLTSNFCLLRFRTFSKFGSNFQEVGSFVWSLLYQGSKPDDVRKKSLVLFTEEAPFALRTTELMLSKRAPRLTVDIEYEASENDPPIDRFRCSLNLYIEVQKKREARKKKSIRQTRRREQASEKQKKKERTKTKLRIEKLRENTRLYAIDETKEREKNRLRMEKSREKAKPEKKDE